MTDRTHVDGRSATVLGGAFYVAVALIALAGQTGAAVRWLAWTWPAALAAVAALELGAVTLSAWADFRMRLGERAYPARALSAAVAVFAVVIQWYGHPSRIQAGFFAGMSALGYAMWLIQSGARRRDQLRAVGMLPPVPPAYGPVQWLRRPWLTRRARTLALADPGLGLYGSLASAREQVRAERRNAAIAASLRKMLTEGKDPLPAEIAVNVFDTDEIARVIAAGADYDGLARLIAATLVPRKVLPGQPPTPRGKATEGTGVTAPTEPPAADEATTAPPQAPAPRPARGNRAGNRGRRAVRNHGAAAINNARQLRLTYPHGIT
ncbi:MAG TPA: hypothetical protein VHA75_14420, partial [Rugosimonospora sp.]|nr:hypothetical protein [Rugosimonospora sp.]